MSSKTTLTLLSVLATGLASLSALGWGSAAAADATEPYLVRSSLIARAKTWEGYWQGADKAFDRWSWLPEVKAQILGPLPAGSQVMADFSRPDGKPWMSLRMQNYASRTPPLANGEAADFTTETPTQAQEKLSLMEGGNIGFQVRAVVNGANKVLFKGRMKVVKAHSGVPGPNFANHFLFYNDYDWLANAGYYSQNTLSDPKAPPVEMYAWLKGAGQESGKIKGYLFYKGKQIGTTADTMNGVANDVMSITPTVNIRDQDEQLDWKLWQFTFSRVYAFWGHGPNDSARLPEGGFVLANNPGDYEFKLMRNGQLVRTGSFTMQPDTYLKPTGFYEYNFEIASGMDKEVQDKARVMMFVPLKAAGTQDGTINPNAWKTEAWWGNP